VKIIVNNLFSLLFILILNISGKKKRSFCKILFKKEINFCVIFLPDIKKQQPTA